MIHQQRPTARVGQRSNTISTSFYPTIYVNEAKEIKRVGLFVSITGKRAKNYLRRSDINIVSSGIDIVYPNKYLSLRSSVIDIVSSDMYIIHPKKYMSIRSSDIDIVSSDINIVYPNKYLSIQSSNIEIASSNIDIFHPNKYFYYI